MNTKSRSRAVRRPPRFAGERKPRSAKVMVLIAMANTYELVGQQFGR